MAVWISAVSEAEVASPLPAIVYTGFSPSLAMATFMAAPYFSTRPGVLSALKARHTLYGGLL